MIVPTDFSDAALVALKAAVDLRQKSGADVILLHVTEPGYEGLRVQTGELHDEMNHAALDALKKLAATHFPDAAGVHTIAKTGRPAVEICQTAAEVKADAIIIATHGHSGLKHVLLGSVAEKVVRHAPCSVLVVRK